MSKLYRLSWLIASVLFAPLANAQESGLIDYRGFVQLAEKIEPYRESRRIDLETFNRMKAEPGTLVLDARSATNYALGHIDGATHLEFTDFSAPKLATVLPSKTTRILIYCNNNFTNNLSPVVLKAAPLALNVPTFINLYGYGYENVYELSGAYSIDAPEIGWTGTFE